MAGTYIDCLPTQDILHWVIMPMLDYESRINLNRILAPFERGAKKFTKEAILGHDGKIIMEKIKSHLNYIDDSTHSKTKRSRKIISLIRFLIRDPSTQFIMNYPKFKETIIRKMKSFCDPLGGEIGSASNYFKKKIRKVAKILVKKLNSAVCGQKFKIGVICVY